MKKLIKGNLEPLAVTVLAVAYAVIIILIDIYNK